MAWTYVVPAGSFHARAFVNRGPVPTQMFAPELFSEVPGAIIRPFFAEPPPVVLSSRLARTLPEALQPRVREWFALRGICDTLAVNAVEPDGHGVNFSIGLPAGMVPAPRVVGQLRCVSAHMLSAQRLRQSLGPPAIDPADADAVLTPSGGVAHAAGEAKSGAARVRLAEAVRLAERARGRLRRTDPQEALALWRGLVDGRWSLVDHCESDGRRLVLARRNEPRVRDVRALTPRERAVAAFVARGHSNKYVAYALGLSPATIAAHLSSAQAKLGVRSRRALIALLSSAVWREQHGGGDPLDAAPSNPSTR